MPKPRRRQFCYDYPRPMVTADSVIFTIMGDDLKVLLIRRGRPPFKDRWAIPGGFVEMGESLEQAARRELEEETGVRDVHLEQLSTFGDPKRDPRGRVISVAYFVLVNAEALMIQAADDASAVRWFSMYALPPLAFDHDRVLDDALKRLRSNLEWTAVGADLLPRKFALRELQRIHEIILGHQLDTRNFRKKMLTRGLLQQVKEIRQKAQDRRARLYRFARPEARGAI